jgi:signal transduction histidine kinase
MSEEMEIEESQSRAGVKVLVVDDREDNLFSIETILEKDGYTIVKANSGRAALKTLLQQQDFTIILMDVQMPDMNGFETATLIYERERLKDIPIIFITAHNSDDDNMYKGYKMGAVDFIYKPINPELLRLKVAVFAELYRKNRQLSQQETKLKQANWELEREVEERKMNEEKIRLLNEKLIENNTSLEATVEELDRFAYVASHDLQEPLRKIKVFSDRILMRIEAVDEEVKRSLEKIVKASDRMQILISDLLKFSRQTSGNENFATIQLNELINEVLGDIEVDIERVNADIIVDQLPQVWAIPSQVRQLFQNLISNGLKFTRDGVRPQVKIYASVRVAKPGFCSIVVEDNGIGFEQKYAEDIFVVFKRLHSYHEYQGTGVGLSICKKIVERHQGSIYAESTVNEGSKFYIELPALVNGVDIPLKDLSPLPLAKELDPVKVAG